MLRTDIGILVDHMETSEDPHLQEHMIENMTEGKALHFQEDMIGVTEWQNMTEGKALPLQEDTIENMTEGNLENQLQDMITDHARVMSIYTSMRESTLVIILTSETSILSMMFPQGSIKETPICKEFHYQ